MREMVLIHVQYSWWVHVVGLTLIAIGIAVILSRLIDQIRQLNALVQETQAARASAEDASQTKSAFLTSVSHELRTPLNAICGFAEMMRDLPSARDADWYRARADIIFSSGRHLTTLVESLLDLSKIESGQVELRIEPTEFMPLTQEITDLFAPRVDEAGLTLSLQVEPSDLVASIDPVAMRQVLINLINNAIHHTQSGGNIQIAANQAEDGSLAIDVSDTGSGISPHVLPNLFEPFPSKNPFQAEPGAGFGLGLAICKGIVTAHGGSISAHSTSSAGTTIRIVLPRPTADSDVNQFYLPLSA